MRGRQPDRVRMSWFALQLGLHQSETRILEFSPGLPCGWQEGDCWSHHGSLTGPALAGCWSQEPKLSIKLRCSSMECVSSNQHSHYKVKGPPLNVSLSLSITFKYVFFFHVFLKHSHINSQARSGYYLNGKFHAEPQFANFYSRCNCWHTIWALGHVPASSASHLDPYLKAVEMAPVLGILHPLGSPRGGSWFLGSYQLGSGRRGHFRSEPMNGKLFSLPFLLSTNPPCQ